MITDKPSIKSWSLKTKLHDLFHVPKDLGLRPIYREVRCDQSKIGHEPSDENYKWHREMDGAFYVVEGHAQTPHGFFSRKDIFFSDYLFKKTLAC